MGKTRRKNPIKREMGQHVATQQKESARQKSTVDMDDGQDDIQTDAESEWFFEQDPTDED